MIKRERTDVKKDELMRYFFDRAGEAVRKISDVLMEDIQEIRLRVNRPVSATVMGAVRYITDNGQLTYNPESSVIVNEQTLRRSFEAVCQYSVHSFQSDISEGFITLRGGHRVGICGTVIMRSGIAENVKNISSLNFRIARETIGCADELCRRVFSDGLCSILIAGAPASGKTTMLRDTARILGERYRTAVIDERGELAAVMNGVPQNNVGINTDVFDGYDKPRGIMTAIRVMSPQIIICDEIGSSADFAAIRAAASSGVCIAASVHGANMDGLKCKGIDLNTFDKTVFLGTESGLGKISDIVKRNEYKND